MNNQQQQHSEEQIFDNLIKCIEMTQSGNAQLIKQGEDALESQHQRRRFGVLLLKLLTQNNINNNIKLGASIYFKNYVKKYWGRDEEIISKSDQQFIKTAIVRVMLQANKNTQRLLSQAITIIASHDFYMQWDTLLPELIDKLKCEQNFENICGVLQIIESITCRYPDKEKNIHMINEIKYILELFQDIWLKMLAKWSAPIVELFINNRNCKQPTNSINKILSDDKNGKNSINQIKYQILSIQQLILIFFDLNSVDLIAFFENKMNSWAKIYQALLGTNDKFNIFTTRDDTAGPIDKLRTAIVRALKLFNSKYEEEYSKYVAIFVGNVCELLTTINDNERYDHLAAESIGYLSSVAFQQWNVNLFNKTQILTDIVSRILIRNIRLRESDINMYECNGEDWIRRDMEGSDLYTRRRGAIDLVRGLSKHFEAQISTIIVSHIAQLITNKNYIDKDTAINLILAVSIKGCTKLLGATKINPHVPVMQFFQQHILPELNNNNNKQHPIILSDCLKFVITFRSQWPTDNFLQLLPMACKFLEKDDYVLHTYAAIAIDKILAMKENSNEDDDKYKYKYKYPKKLLLQSIEKILIALFTVLNTREESNTNEYIMKCILRVISRGEQGCISVIEPVIKQCSIILLNVSKNPQRPTFNHYMFECIAALIIFSNNNNNNKSITQFEQILMAPFMKILEMEQCSEFHPYIYQIIGLMLRIKSSVDNNYLTLFDKLLETSLWNNDGNIIAISSTFADYLRLNNNNSNSNTFINDRRLTGMLGIYQHLLSKRTQDYHAFNILCAIFQYIPIEKLTKYLKEIIQLVCMRIRAKKSTALCCRFIISLSIFIIKNGLSQILMACNQIQNGIFAMILEKIWLTYARNVSDLIDRKILTIGMIKLCDDKRFQSNKELFVFFPNLINVIVEIFEAGPLKSNEHKTSDFYISKLEEQGAGNKFVGLSFAKSPTHDITSNMNDPRLLLIQLCANMIGQNIQNQQAFAKRSKPIICKTINRYAQQFNIDFSLPINQ